MRSVNIHAAKTHLSRLVDEAAGGEEIIIAKAGKPVGGIEITPIIETAVAQQKLKIVGGIYRLANGRIDLVA